MGRFRGGDNLIKAASNRILPNNNVNDCFKNPLGTPYGNRTRVSAVKGQRPRPLDEGRVQE